MVLEGRSAVTQQEPDGKEAMELDSWREEAERKEGVADQGQARDAGQVAFL